MKATQLFIDALPLKSNSDILTLTFTDNGNGMEPEKMYKMLRYNMEAYHFFLPFFLLLTFS